MDMDQTTMGLGWKTITGTLMIAIGYGLAQAWTSPVGIIVSTTLTSAGIALGGYGLRSAVAKNAVVSQTLTAPTIATSQSQQQTPGGTS